jgi:hypothetical protein
MPRRCGCGFMKYEVHFAADKRQLRRYEFDILFGVNFPAVAAKKYLSKY